MDQTGLAHLSQGDHRISSVPTYFFRSLLGLAANVHPAPPSSSMGYISSCGSERFELLRKTKILAVIHRAIDHGRLSAR